MTTLAEPKTKAAEIVWLDLDGDGVSDAIALCMPDGTSHRSPLHRKTVWPPFPSMCAVQIHYVKHRDALPLAALLKLPEGLCYRIDGEPVIILYGFKPLDTDLAPSPEKISDWNLRWREGQIASDAAKEIEREKLRKQKEAAEQMNSVRNAYLDVKEKTDAMNRAVDNIPEVKMKRLENQVQKLLAENAKLKQAR